jgi:hypothetical protein
MRRIVSSFNLGKAEHEVLFEALAGSCTQLKAAKELTFDSSVLQRVPEHLRSRFLSAVAAASATEGGTKVFHFRTLVEHASSTNAGVVAVFVFALQALNTKCWSCPILLKGNCS